MKRVIIWDLDGTIVDSRATITSLMQKAAESLGLEPLDSDQIRAIVGLSLLRAVEVMLPHLKPEDAQTFAHHYQKHAIAYYETPDYRTPLYAGMHDLIRGLKSETILQGLATGNSRKGVRRFLDHHDLHNHFDFVQTADDAPSKPDPQMVLAHMAHLNLGPHQAVVVGDTVYDYQMAKSAGVDFIGVTHGFHTPQELRSQGVQVIASSVDDLKQKLEAWMAQEMPDAVSHD